MERIVGCFALALVLVSPLCLAASTAGDVGAAEGRLLGEGGDSKNRV